MNKKLIFIILAMVLGMTIHAQSYPYKYYFRNINRADGLSQTDIKAIIQDRHGFMWFGTRNRLNRYDGNTIRVFDCVDRKTSKRNNNISSIFEDAKGELWVGTDKGVFVYNPVTEQFRFIGETTKGGMQMQDWVADIKSDADGNIWLVLPNQGLFRYRQGSSLKMYSFGSARHPDSVSPQCMCIDNSGRLWVGTDGSGVYLYNKSQDTFVQYLGDNDGTASLAGENVYTMCDYGDDLVLGIHEGKLRRLNKRRNIVADFNAPQVHYSIIRDVKRYNDELWVGTQRGIYVINEHNGTIEHIEHDAMCSYSLSDNQIGRIYRDREGGIWIGTNLGGVNYLPRKGMSFMRYVPLTKPFTITSKRIREMVEDDQGNIWIGTDDAGVNVYNPATGTFKVIGKDIGGKLHSEKTLAMMSLSGRVWLGFFKDGLDIIEQSSFQPRHFSGEMLKMNESSIYAMCEDAHGNIWLGNAWGVYVASKGSMEFKRIDAFGFNYIYDIIEDNEGFIWVATMGNGVYRYNPVNKQIKHFNHVEGQPKTISSNSVSSVMETSRGEIWFSTDRGGVCRYNRNDETFTTFSIEQGLPDDTGYKILEDKNGMLWFGTNNGLVKLDPATGNCQIYTTYNGLPGNQFNYKSALKTRSGIFYFGSSEGLISFNPYYVDKNTIRPQVYITRLWVNNNEIFAADDSPLHKSLIHTKSIELDYDQSSISLEFSALSYVMPHANQYLYKMDGVDDNWIKVEAGQRISYSNLSPGKYVFRVKGSNNDGVWCEADTELEIIIKRPWWRSIWAWMFYLLLIGVAIWCLFNWYRKRTLQKSEEAQRLFEAEKEKELYQNKIDFFTSIAHEIRTPLTLINGPLENLQEMSIADPEIQRNLNTMSRNTNDLMNLINQLLDFRKMDSSKMEMYFVSVNISSLLREWVNKFADMHIYKSHNVTLDLPEGDDLYVRADRNALIKILNNLFSNALKYSDHEFLISLCADGDNVVAHFENDGKIIPQELREKIFMPFYQLRRNENATSSSGIGLYLARSLAEMMDGSLTYKEHQGLNCFVLTMKRVEKEPEIDALGEDMMLVDDDVVPEALQSALILLVEDNVEMLNFVADKLRNNYAVETALNGVEAMKVLKEKNIDLVLSDIMMPEMDGLELCRHIKEDIELSHIPVILLTAKNDLDSKVEGLKIGADAYIEKPFAFKYLVAQITSIFENRRRGMDAFMRKPFVPSTAIGMSKADEVLMQRIVNAIEENIDNTNFGVEMLAELVCMSRSSLHRKIKSISDSSPTDFIRMVRLKKASELISQGGYRVGEVCYLVGINSPSYFIKLFQKQFGMTPKEFEKQQRQLREQSRHNETLNDIETDETT